MWFPDGIFGDVHGLFLFIRDFHNGLFAAALDVAGISGNQEWTKLSCRKSW